MKPVTIVAAGCLFAASLARAGDGYVTGDVDLRAGPDPDYPTVATLNAGTPVSIQGCVANWSWCDVATASDRGWVAGDFLEEDYEGQRVVVPAFGVQVGIPIIRFSFDAYWGAHYHNEHYQTRSWYSDRARWAKVRPRYAPPMRHPIDPNAGKGAEHPAPHVAARSDHAQPAHAAQPAYAQPPATRESVQPAHAEANMPKPPAQPARQAAQPPVQHENSKSEHASDHGNDAKGKDKDEVRKDEKGSNAPGKDADTNKHQR